VKTAAVYARVSTDEQAREGTSLGAQQRLAHERAERDGGTIADEHVYVDAGISGKTADRPEYQRMLADAAAGTFGVLFVWKFDRLGRDAEELLRARRMLAAADVSIVSLTEGEAESTLVYGVRALVSQEEREKIAERSRMGLAEVARQGGWKGGEAPYGYRSAGNRTLEVVETEAAVVRLIESMYLGGDGATKTARLLNEAGYRTRHGRLWTKVQVLGILDSPVYVGMVQYAGETYPGNHQPLRDDETWQRILALRNARRRSPTGGRGAQPRRHLLTKGMLRCVCGRPMGARTFKTGYDYYVCNGRENAGCHQAIIRREVVDEPLLAMFETHVLDIDATIAQIRGEANRQIREAREFSSATELELARIDDALARVRSDYLAGDLTAADWTQLRSDLQQDREAQAAELARHRDRAAELARDTDRLDAEQELAGRLTEIRQLVAGRVAESATVDAIRAALTSTFEQFQLASTAEGFVAVPRLRADRRLDVARTPDEMLLPVKRVGLCSREATSGARG
jgi:site-specific DNA recombinase